MIGIGGFSPLTGFMTKADWKGVCENFLMADGTFWPVPVCLDVTKEDAAAINVGDEIALYDPEGDEIMATMKVTEKFEHDRRRQEMGMRKGLHGRRHPDAEEFWKIAEEDHPGVQMVMARNRQPGRPGQGAQRRRLPHQVCRRLPSSGRIPQDVRRSRLERRGRPAAAQPHAPLPRIPVQNRRGSV
jgi:hypothetical protein